MLAEKIHKDYTDAMKSRDALKVSVLSLLRAGILNAAVAGNKKELDDREVISVIKKQVKQRQDSIEQFTKGGRPEMAEKEEQELKILRGYLPAGLSPEEIKKAVDEAITSTGAQGIKDMGKVMKEVMAKVGDKADGKLLSDLVKQKLGIQ